MESTVVWYLRMSLIYFVAGVVLGLAMLIWPDESGYFLPGHVHFNLLGFMSMMIYGVGYHILPKFSGQLVYSPVIIKIQFWLANVGLAGMAMCWPFTSGAETGPAGILLIASAFFVVLSAILFAYNMFKTIKSV